MPVCGQTTISTPKHSYYSTLSPGAMAVSGVPQINVHFTATTEHSHEWSLEDRDKPSLYMTIRIQLFYIEW